MNFKTGRPLCQPCSLRLMPGKLYIWFDVPAIQHERILTLTRLSIKLMSSMNIIKVG